MIEKVEELKLACYTFAVMTHAKYTKSRKTMYWVVSKILSIGT